MLLDVLIPSNGQLTKLQPLLECISAQTLQPDRVVILIHKHLTREEQDTLLYFLQRSVYPELAQRIVLVTNLTADYEPGHGVGYDRNTLLRYAQAKFVRMIDHDNVFKKNMFQDTADRRIRLKEELGKDLIVSPTILRRKTVKIQSQGITKFFFLVPKYIYNHMSGEPWQQVKMIGGNSLFGLRETFQKFPFDERFKRCYEDIDMTYRLTQAGIPLVVLNKVEIHHMEARKTPLEQLFLGTPVVAHERSRNRILFVKKNANLRQKIQYFGCGLWVQTAWFFAKILIYGGKQRMALLKAVREGTKEGL